MDLAFWANIATVWLAILCFIGLLIPLAVAIFVVKGMHVAVDRTPRFMRQAQGYARAARTQVEVASQRVAEPVVQSHKHTSRLAVTVDRIFRRRPAQ